MKEMVIRKSPDGISATVEVREPTVDESTLLKQLNTADSEGATIEKRADLSSWSDFINGTREAVANIVSGFLKH